MSATGHPSRVGKELAKNPKDQTRIQLLYPPSLECNKLLHNTKKLSLILKIATQNKNE